MGSELKIDVEIVTKVLKYNNNSEKVRIHLNNGESTVGTITRFDGTTIEVTNDRNERISIFEIKNIEKYVEVDYASFLGKRVSIDYLENESVTVKDGVIVSVDDLISLVTEEGILSVNRSNITKIVVADAIISNLDAEETISSDDKKVKEEAKSTTKSEEKKQESIHKVDKDNSAVSNKVEIVELHEPDELERAIIDGKPGTINYLLKNREKLVKLGYTDKEISRIEKNIKVSWKQQDDYSIASRLYSMIVNRDQLAEKYYVRVINTAKRDSDEFIKSINVLTSIIISRSASEIVDFYEKYSASVNFDERFRIEYIISKLELAGIEVNPFELSIIRGKKSDVGNYIGSSRRLLDLGYDESDIDRIGKAYQAVNWELSLYWSAYRVQSMILNKNRIAERLYEEALTVEPQNIKILNTLATIKSTGNREGYIPFFEKNIKNLKKNKSYCMAYVNAVIATRDLEKIQVCKDSLYELVADIPEMEAKIDSEIGYLQRYKDFSLKNNTVLWQRLEILNPDDESQVKERNWLLKLPEKEAVHALLHMYSFKEKYDLFCEVFIIFIDSYKSNKAIMDLLRRALCNCGDNNVIRILPYIPILWCDEVIVKRYVSACERLAVISTNKKAGRLGNIIPIVENYPSLNQFENAIIDNNIEKIKAYIDEPQDLLISGYDEEEIHDISLIDMDAYQNQISNSYTMRNIITFQGNKNHVAERFIFDAYFANKLDMCNRLFTLLLEEKRGDLILELFEYDSELKDKLSSGSRFFYLALCYAEKNDDVFWNELKDKWVDYPEKDIEERLLSIAEKKGDTLRINQLSRQLKKYSTNEFERAVIEGNNDVIRKYVKNAGLLVNLGYSPDEIQRISSIFTSSPVDMGTTANKVAQRVYLYQKNKNGLAESLFWESISDSTNSEEEKLLASKFLFQICNGQKNYALVCELYEKYLYKEMSPKFNEAYAMAYASALFMTEKYETFIDYHSTNKPNWPSFSLYAMLLYAEEKMDCPSDNVEIWENVMSSTLKADIIANYICLLFEKKVITKYQSHLVPLFNRYLLLFTASDLSKIKMSINVVDMDLWNTPISNGVLLMCESEENDKRLTEWMKYLKLSHSIEERCDIFLQMSNVICASQYIIVQNAFELCEEAVENSTDKDRLNSLIAYLSQSNIDGHSKQRLLSIFGNMLSNNPNEIVLIRNIWKLDQELNCVNAFFGVVEKINASLFVNQEEITDYSQLLVDFYQDAKETLSLDQQNKVLDQILYCAGRIRFGRDALIEVNSFLIDKKYEQDSSMISMILTDYCMENDEEQSEEKNESEGKYIDVLTDILGSRDDINFPLYISGWKSYFSLSEKDVEIIEKLNNTVGKSEKWLRQEVNILAKALFVEPDNNIYWNLIYKWYGIQIGVPGRVYGNLLKHIHFETGEEIEKAIEIALKKGQNETAVVLILEMMENYKEYIISGQKLLRKLISQDKSKNNELNRCGQRLLNIIFEDFETTYVRNSKWNSVCAALDIAKKIGGLKQFLQLFSKYLAGEYAKQCSVVLAEALVSDETEIIQPAKELMLKSYSSVPYKELILSKFDKYYNGGLTDDDKVLLELVTKDYGNNLGINDYFEFYCEMALAEKKEQGIHVIKNLQEFYPDDVVLHEILASFVACPQNEDERELLYCSLFKYYDDCQDSSVVEYAVGRMICGEKYFKLQRREVPSFSELVKKHFPSLQVSAKKYMELCDGIQIMLRNTQYEEFACVILRALFACDWREVFDYDIDDALFDDVVKNLYSNRINAIDDYHRSFIKSVMLHLLNNHEGAVYRKNRIRKLWNQLKVVGCSYDAFLACFEKIDDSYKKEVSSIWNMDIETFTIFRQFWGRYILQQKNCDMYMNIFGVFTNTRGNDIFANDFVCEPLLMMSDDRAVAIATAFESIYARPIGFINLIQTDKKVLKSANYEINAFSEYLKSVNPKYNELDVCCERYKKKYDFLREMYLVDKFSGAECLKLPIEDRRAIYSVRALWYYYYVLSNDDKYIEFPGLISSDFINTVSVACTKSDYLVYLDQFIDKFSPEYSSVAGIVLYICVGELEKAYEKISIIRDRNLRGRLAQRIEAASGKDSRNSELWKKCEYYVNAVRGESNYWVKNFSLAKNITSLDIEEYINRDDNNEVPRHEATPIEIQNEQENSKKVETNLNSTEMDEHVLTSNGNSDKLSHASEERSVFGNEAYEIEVDTDKYEDEESESELIKKSEQIEDEDTYEEEMDADSYTSAKFLPQFMELTCDDVMIGDLQKRIQILEKSVEGNTIAELQNLIFEAGVHYLRINEAHIDEEIFAEVCKMIKPNSIKNVEVFVMIQRIFNRYILEHDSIEELCDSFSEIRESLNNLSLPQDKIDYSNKRIKEDLMAMAQEIKVLGEIALDVRTISDDERLAEKLGEWQVDLNKMSTSETRKIYKHISLMMRNKVDKLNKKAVIKISHDDLTYKNEETWSKGVENGKIRGIVKNTGGADAKNVELSVSINGISRRKFYISTIKSGETIPFAVLVSRQDINNGEISWTASATYEDNGEMTHVEEGHGVLYIHFTDNEWDSRLVGKELFEADQAAEGEAFCGRHVYMAELLGLYDKKKEPRSYPSILVTGLKRTGKSSIIKRLCVLLSDRDDIIPIYIDGQGSPRAYKAFIKAVMDDYLDPRGKDYVGDDKIYGDYDEFNEKWTQIAHDEFWYEELPTFYRDLSDLLGGRKIIFVLDEMESVFYSGNIGSAQTEENFLGVLRAIIQNYQMFVSFVFCGSDRLLSSCLDQKRESQLFQVLWRKTIERMSLQEIRTIFDRYNNKHDIKFTDEAINEIMKYTGGHVWYTKSIAFKLLEKIIDRDRIITPAIHLYDVDSVIEMLIEGDLGNDYFDLIDKNFGSRRKAITRAMARCMSGFNESVSIEKICIELEKMNYVDNESGESISSLTEKEVLDNLKVLEKMDFVKRDAQYEKSYQFAIELYRLFMLDDKEIKKFIVKRAD